MKDEKIVLVHLSDIHFKHEIEGTVYDLDDDLRNELELDATTQVKRLENIDGIVITGDIAFSGVINDYEKAWDWLIGLCDIFGCQIGNVWSVPGNHDVNRTLIEKSPTVQMYHSTLRDQKPNDVDKQILRFCHQDEEAKLSLFRSIDAYNEFAERFHCEIDAKKPFWEDDMPLNDGSTLRLRGLSSVLVSDKLDDTGANKLIMGTHQYALSRTAGVAYLTLCHHPPQWLLDADAIESALHARSRIQLFGHKHFQKINEINGNVRITAGAVHPNRRELGWEPRYNYLVIGVEENAGNRRLSLDVLPRVWHKNEKCFVGEVFDDGRDYRPFSLPLEEWTPPSSSELMGDNDGRNGETNGIGTEDDEMEKTKRESGHIVNPARTLTYRFLSLPYVSRIEVAQVLGLLEDYDKGVRDGELFRRFFRRAKEKDILARLWNEVEVRHADGRYSENPFE